MNGSLFKSLSCIGLVLLANAAAHATTQACMTAEVDALWAVEGRALLFPPASDPLRQGFVRVINRSNRRGEIRVHPVDDAGREYEALTLAIEANATVHFNSGDLEAGNAAKGLSGASGPGEGHWRLDFLSELDIEVLSYIRNRDGFLTAMHDIVLQGEEGCQVAIFNPASNWRQVSILRLVNLGSTDAAVTIRGTDDQGVAGLGAVGLTIPAGAAAAVTAQDLESGGTGLDGRLGDGSGKWRLVVDADQPVVAMSLMESPTGHLTNLSSAPSPAAGGAHRVPLFPAAGDASGRQGFARVINRSPSAGEVSIRAHDETGRAYPPISFPIGANEVVHVNSDDLEQGGAKGLSGGTGAGTGDWRLDLTSDLDIDVLAFIRTQDGFLTSMHDLALNTGNLHRAFVFNPGSNWRQVSRLRLVNLGDAPAAVVITGTDDRGESSGSPVELELAAGAARELDAAELEAGSGVDGALGDGTGKWRLVVESLEPLLAMSLMESPTGHLTNLSAGSPRWDPILTEDDFTDVRMGSADGVQVAIVDGDGFDPGQHGQRVTDVFLANTTVASLTQIRGYGSYQLRGVSLGNVNSTGAIRHALRNRAGIFFTATDVSLNYFPDLALSEQADWFLIDDRPFHVEARTFARWARHENVLLVSSLENPTGKPSEGGGFDAVYCDEFDLSRDYPTPDCGIFDDYVAHTGTGIEKVIFVGAIDRFGTAGAAIRADGVFAPHAIYVESPDGSTSQATPVLAAYATNLAFANPKWGAARLKQELMDLAREETIEYATGGSDEHGTGIFERRTIKVIRPSFAP